MGCPSLAIHPTDAQALSIHGAHLASPSLSGSRGSRGPERGAIPPGTHSAGLKSSAHPEPDSFPWAGLAVWVFERSRLQEAGVGRVRSSLSQQTPPPGAPPMNCVPASHLGASASPQEGQEDGPAGWRARLKPVEKKSPAER